MDKLSSIEQIRTISGRHPIKNYPFSRDGFAFRCKACEGIWLKKKEAENHVCQPKD
jgi:hypothetical protein